MSFLNAHIVGVQVSMDEYRKQTVGRGADGYVFSRSDLCSISECPHKWVSGFENPDSVESVWGKLIDAMLLTDGKRESPFVVSPEFYTNDKGLEKPWNNNAAVCQEWNESHADQFIIGHKIYEEAQQAAYSMRDDPFVKSVLDGSQFQVHVQGFYRTGCGKVLPIKALIDIVPSGECSNRLYDLKTTTDASVGKWERKVFDMGYHVQAALYMDLFNAATGESRDTFCHIIQEKDSPYEVGRRMLDESFLEIGRKKYRDALDLAGACVLSGKWPGYDEIGNGTNIRGYTISSPKAWMILS
jgi:hypothetical protein